MVALFHFYHTEKLEKNFFRASFIALIPKKAGAEELEGLRTNQFDWEIRQNYCHTPY